jgi:hypothetical protein
MAVSLEPVVKVSDEPKEMLKQVTWGSHKSIRFERECVYVK